MRSNPTMTAHRLWLLARAAIAGWRADGAASMGAALAFYALFSVGPLLLLAVSIAGLAYGDAAARGEVARALRGVMGDAGAAALQVLLKSVRAPGEGALGGLIGAGLLLLGAFSVLVELQNALDRIWRAPPRRGAALLRARLRSFAMVLGAGFLLLALLVVSAAVAALAARGTAWPGGAALAGAVDFAVSLALVGATFALLYKTLPRVPVRWRDVWPGAAVSAVLFAIGKQAIALYIGSTALGSAYGAAAALVVLLVWTYWSTQIFLLGAELVRVCAQARDARAAPADPAPGGSAPAPPCL